MSAASIAAARWRPPHPGAIAALLLLALFAGALLSLIAASGGMKLSDLQDPYLLRLVRTSLFQAALSTLLSLCSGALIALSVARLPSRRGARLLRALLLAMGVAPTIVIVLGIVTVYGGSGMLAAAARKIGLGWPSIYGLAGILIAHTAMNGAYAARVFLNALAEVPPEHHRIAAICGLSPWQTFRQCDWPALRREAPALAALVMLLCFTSFAVVLTLGGGPRYATLEVAIYEALRIEVDFGRAALLSLAQIAFALGFVALAARAVAHAPAGDTSGGRIARADAGSRGLRRLDFLILAAAVLLLAPIPLASLAGARAAASLLDGDVAAAAATSLALAVPAGLLCLHLATLIASAATSRDMTTRPFLLGALPLLALAMPPFALIAGLYVPLRRFGDNATLGYILVPFVNALMALPFAYRLIEPALRLARLRYGRLADHLALRGMTRLILVDWPLLRRPLIAAFAMATALSLGDFGVAALFGGQEFRTLPLLLYERMGAYRLEEAQAVALLLILIAFALAYATEHFADAPRR